MSCENTGVDTQKREEVRAHYANTAKTSCSCGTSVSNIYSPEQIAELPADTVKASRGCADPHAFAQLKEGETVIDLGSGGGIDSLLAAREVGSAGRVIGVDMTDEMLQLARKNAAEGGFSNVEFRQGYIEDLKAAGIEDACADVVISNCVINLSTDKPAVLAEAFRVLKPGGRFVVADVVGLKRISAETSRKLADFLGCMSGVLVEDDYRDLLEGIGFTEVSIEPTKVYCADRLRKRAERKGADYPRRLAAIDLDEADSAMAGSIVIAHKAGA